MLESRIGNRTGLIRVQKVVTIHRCWSPRTRDAYRTVAGSKLKRYSLPVRSPHSVRNRTTDSSNVNWLSVVVSRSYSQTKHLYGTCPTGATIWSAIRRPSGCRSLGSRKPRRSWVSGVAFPSRSTADQRTLVGGINLQIGKSAGGDAESGLCVHPPDPGGTKRREDAQATRLPRPERSRRLRTRRIEECRQERVFCYRLNVRLRCNGAVYLLGSKPVAHLLKPTGRCANWTIPGQEMVSVGEHLRHLSGLLVSDLRRPPVL